MCITFPLLYSSSALHFLFDFCAKPLTKSSAALLFAGHGNLSLKDLLMFAQRDYVADSKLTIGPTLDTASILQLCLIA